MSALTLKLHAYRYFPYERELARREAEVLLGGTARYDGDQLRLSTGSRDWASAARLTYFASASDGKRATTTAQAQLEQASGNGHRQNTRYSAHGLHDYRGKFNPQLVRAIGNIIGLGPGASIIDPFCGSGTTLVEAAHASWNAVGIDINPLGAAIAQAKVAALHSDPRTLTAACEGLLARVGSTTGGLDYTRPFPLSVVARWGVDIERLPNLDYLREWFPRSVLEQCSHLFDVIDHDVPVRLRMFYRLIVSDFAREFSYQDPGDLRIRRRKQAITNGELIPRFVAAARARTSSIVAARLVLGRIQTKQRAWRADSRLPLDWLKPSSRGAAWPFDAAITSPPYATALPYIDTQRLSLCLLGFANADDIASLQRELTGTREITDSVRKRVEARIEAGDNAPSTSVLDLCRRMLRLARRSGNGFRRRNMPALTYMYFEDMGRVFRNVRGVTSRGAPFALVVGPSRTSLAEVAISIPTPVLLGDVAVGNGWDRAETLKMDAYHRYNLHSRNSIRSEQIVVLKRM